MVLSQTFWRDANNYFIIKYLLRYYFDGRFLNNDNDFYFIILLSPSRKKVERNGLQVFNKNLQRKHTKHGQHKNAWVSTYLFKNYEVSFIKYLSTVLDILN